MYKNGLKLTSAHTRSYIQSKREDFTYFIVDISFKIIFNYLDMYQGLITKQNKLYKILKNSKNKR